MTCGTASSVAARFTSTSARSASICCRALVAACSAAASAALALTVHKLPADGRLPDYFFSAAPEVAHGLNLVNVTLVDFRALDTLVETLVVILACVGVLGLLTGREWPSRKKSEHEKHA